MRLLAYKGKSWISKIIKRFTRSPYSHVALELGNGEVWEAWHKGGVVKRTNYHYGHTPGTHIDVFVIDGEVDEAVVRDLASRVEGEDYGFSNVFRFGTRAPAKKDGTWFCSHLVLHLVYFGGVTLLNTIENYDQMSPRDVLLSPLLTYETSKITMETGK